MGERKRGTEREEREGRRREAEAAAPEEWPEREGKKKERMETSLQAGKGETGSGQSLSLKGTGYPYDRAGQYNYNSLTMCP